MQFYLIKKSKKRFIVITNTFFYKICSILANDTTFKIKRYKTFLRKTILLKFIITFKILMI
jgi:hypothetical protein